MRKIILFGFPLVLSLIVFFVISFFLSKDKGKGALQVTATPESNVYLNGNFIGKTPLCKCEVSEMIPVGTYRVRVAPKDSKLTPFEEKITIGKTLLTVVDRTFSMGSTSEGSVMHLEPLVEKKNSQLYVTSIPKGAEIFLDSNKLGQTPFLVPTIVDSDHEITVKKIGYKEKSVRIKTTKGYKLITVVYLGLDPNSLIPTPLATDSARVASESGLLSENKQMIRILKTPTGFLRVREKPDINSSEVGRVNPGESYELLSEQDSWYEIQLSKENKGFISTTYAQKEE